MTNGLPPLPFGVNLITNIVALVADTVANAIFGTQWGLYLNGLPAIVADSVVSFEFKEEWKLAKYPLEQGAFANYNKVQVPFDVMFRFSAGGTLANRLELLESAASVIGSLQLFDAITPEKTYFNVNPTHYDYKRTAKEGVGLIQLDLYCELVNIVSQAAFSETQSPSGQAQVDSGGVQPTTTAITPTAVT